MHNAQESNSWENVAELAILKVYMLERSFLQFNT